jgi:hypothetical protein
MTKRASSSRAFAAFIRSFSSFVIRHSSFVIASTALLLVLPSFAQSPSTPPISADRAAKDGSVWGALVFANNEPAKTKPADDKSANAKAQETKGVDAKTDPKAAEVCPNLAKRLGKVFPYSHFEILGQHNQVVFREYESWVVPSRDVFLKLDSKGAAANGGLNLHVQFWQGQQVLVKTDTVLQPNSPLFISGPKWRDGQLIFVLVLRKVEETKGS